MWVKYQAFLPQLPPMPSSYGHPGHSYNNILATLLESNNLFMRWYINFQGRVLFIGCNVFFAFDLLPQDFFMIPPVRNKRT